MTRRTTVLLLALALAGCGAKNQTRRYAMEGEVKALDPATKTATIAAGKIGDWMEAMTMEYPVKPDAEFQKLHVGDKIQATVIVSGDKYYVTEVRVK
ncbi:MAG: copper-binding protein [Bryobacteraceae bacterium]|jgi:Cu/Ag efflux protein CusF